MLESGINVCFGHDDVFDPLSLRWERRICCKVLHMGLHVCQLMGYGQINDGLNLITPPQCQNIEFAGSGIAAGNSANLIILPAENGFDALRRRSSGTLFGTWRLDDASTQPAQTTVYLEQPEINRLQTVISSVLKSH
ncbi:hypothetical protein [Escherichia coli]|uniref:hypothetical protein n=1 Tax=Escherichia coli TaxID=562 RepID=UPI00388FFA4C